VWGAIFCEERYQTRSDVALSGANRRQNVRAVWNGDEWEPHLVCKVELGTNDSAGDDVAGIDLDIANLVTVAFPDEYVL
jgi:putative transposase